MRLLVRFYGRFLRYKARLAIGFAAVAATRVTDIAITLVVGEALNRLKAGEAPSFLPRLLAWFAAWGLAQALFSFLQRWCVVSASRFVEAELKRDLFAKLARLDFGFHDRTRSGDLVSRLTSDVEAVRMFLGPGLMFALGGLVMVPVTLVMLARREPLLTLVMALPLSLMALSFKLLYGRLHDASLAVQEAAGDLSHGAQENFAGVRVVKGYGREEHQAARFAEVSRRNRDDQVRLARARGLAHALSTGTSQVTFVVILLLGGRAILDGRMGIGDALVFIDLTMKLFWPVLTLGWIAGLYPRAVASAQRIEEVLGRAPAIVDPPGARALTGFDGSFRFEGVSFTYPGAARPALSGLDFEVPAGSVLGVVGPTGSGKTTLLDLFGRLHAAQGTLRMGGERQDELTLASIRAPLGYVPQDSFLFSDTWRENVNLGADAPLSDERLAELARIACLDEELARFEAGYDLRIGERGVTLSGGQRQRTCIARALAREPQVLLLDDALSAVDTETEARLVRHLRAAGAGATVVIAAHRLSSVRHADDILVLSADGRVAQTGTHDELVAAGGWYADTWARQQQRAELEEL
ncbi:MAG: ABC transporter ATP-binding protein [Planctomycetes bacterium]|nr:ABC transporter ATP-binding protein [Planctomycetota bacterium]